MEKFKKVVYNKIYDVILLFCVIIITQKAVFELLKFRNANPEGVRFNRMMPILVPPYTHVFCSVTYGIYAAIQVL